MIVYNKKTETIKLQMNYLKYKILNFKWKIQEVKVNL